MRACTIALSVETVTTSGHKQTAPGTDVFVSYAHADDEVPHGATHGWVTTMVGELRKILRRLLGGNGATIWMDHRLSAGQHVDRTLTAQARSCRTLLLVMSAGYQRSPWCMRELEAFVDVTRPDVQCESVFIVEIGEVPRETWHPAIRQVQSIQFWERLDEHSRPHLHGYPIPSPDEFSRYWSRLNHLAHLISEQLKAEAVSARPAVWVAETTSDVRDERDRLVATLHQHGFVALPEVPYRQDSDEAYSDALTRDLERSVMLVQLLGRDAGRRLPWVNTSPVMLQARIAETVAERRGLPILRWRPRDIVLDRIADAAYRALLTGVQTSSAEEFKQRVVRTLTAPARDTHEPRPAEAEPAADLCILVKADTVDRDLAFHAQDSLADLGVAVVVAPDPQPEQTPEQIRLAQEEQLQTCDGVVLVYGRTLPSWVQSQFAFSRKVLAQRRRGGVWGALLDGPPDPKPDVGLRSPNLLTLECRSGIDPRQLERFVFALRA